MTSSIASIRLLLLIFTLSSRFARLYNRGEEDFIMISTKLRSVPFIYRKARNDILSCYVSGLFIVARYITLILMYKLVWFDLALIRVISLRARIYVLYPRTEPVADHRPFPSSRITNTTSHVTPKYFHFLLPNVWRNQKEKDENV